MSTAVKLDTFTKAYIEAAMWSSTCEPFGTCAKCGKDAPLVQHAKTPHDDDGDEWTLCGNCGDPAANSYEPPMDENYGIEDLAEKTLAAMIADCERFQTEQAELITDENCNNSTREWGTDGQAGHDFWLTRNGHGSGFWDGDWEEPAATKLTDASEAFGEVNLYVGDDGRIYV